MIVVFDLDDTLYPERTYLLSGFRAVARWGAARLGLDERASYEELVDRLDRQGRGRIFDDWLRGRAPAREAVQVYRAHRPDLQLPAESAQVLDQLAGRPLYLVTDGHKGVQARKVEALGIAGRFRRCYLTHRYGRASAKPSLRCFELIRARERVGWGALVYIGDNPAKDFVNLNRAGARTVRVLTGGHAGDAAPPGHEARARISRLAELPALLEEMSP